MMNFSFRNWKLFPKIFIPITLTGVILVGFIFFYVIPHFEEDLFELKEMEIKDLVQTANTMVLSYKAEVDSGNMTKEEAEAEIRKRIYAIRFEGSNYFWVQTSKELIIHGKDRKWENKAVNTFEDDQGNFHLKEIVDRRKAGETDFFVDYYFNNPRTNLSAHKLAYHEYIKDWDWYICAGMYTDEIEEHIADVKISIYYVLGPIFLAMILFVIYLLKSYLINPINRLAEKAQKIAQGDFKVDYKYEYKDEIGQLSQAFDCVGASFTRMEEETMSLVDSALNGQLDNRADSSQFAGSYATLIDGVNKTVDAFVDALNTTGAFIEQISSGDMPDIITEDYKGDYNKIRDNINLLINSMNSFIGEMNEMTEQHKLGDVDYFIDDSKFVGFYQEMAAGTNTAVKLHVDTIGMILELLRKYAEGDFTDKLKQLPGKQAVANEAMDLLRDTMLEFIEEMMEMQNQQGNGEIDYNIPAEKFNGAFHELARGFNDTINELNGAVIKILNTVKAYGEGDLSVVLEQQKGKRAVANEMLNAVRDNLINVRDEIQKIVVAARDGNLQVRADNSKFSADYKAMVDGLNNALDLILHPIAETVEVLQEMAEGNLSVQVTGDYKGDHALLKNAINETINLMPFKEAILVLESLAAGDLTTQMAGAYKGDSLKLKEALNSSIESMHKMVNEVKKTVYEVSKGSMQVSDASSALSQGATEQAASLEEITSSMTEIASKSRTNAENANQANSLTNEARDASERGNSEMGELSSAMNDTKDAARNISQIIKVIDEIAFQTNLLALNAAVEAARAGRHGKGFAVVAEEVRNLAARSAKAAKETSELIENTIQSVERGANLVDITGQALKDIQQGSIKSSDIVGEISTLSDEQASAIAQINEGLTQIDKVTQTNTASAEESASASDELSSQAKYLSTLVAKFTLNEDKVDIKREKRLPAAEKKSLPPVAKDEFYEDINNYKDNHQKPSDIIDLDDDNFGRY